MTTYSLRFPVAVIMRRVPLANRWVSERWEPAAIEPEPSATAAGPVALGDDGGGPRWRFGGFALELHPSEAEGYFLNISAPEPKVFVMWRMPEGDDAGEPVARPVVVTVSYSQAARMQDGGEQVDALPLPPALHDWMRPYVAEHYKPEPRRKVRRNDPFRDEAERQGAAPRGPDRDQDRR